jgi:hypothetical protein
VVVVAGGGIGLASAADIIVAAPEVRFVAAFSTIGLCADTGATYFVSEIGCMPPGWEECSSEAYDATMDRERRGSAQGCPE